MKRSPGEQHVVRRNASIVALTADVHFYLLRPSTRFEVIVALLVETAPFIRRKSSDAMAKMNKIEFLMPSPLLQNVVDFQNAVWGDPTDRWWEQVDTPNYGVRVHIRHINSPRTMPCPNIEDILRRRDG